MEAFVLKKHGSATTAFLRKEIPEPVLGPGQVLISSEGFGLNYADIMARNGLYKDAPPLPSIIGYDVVGKIEKLGEGVLGYTVGQRVSALTRFGGYAQKAVTDARAIIPISDSVPLAEAAALATQYCTAWYASMNCVQLFPGAKVLIHAAAGGVGTALVQIAKMQGCEIFGTVGADIKMKSIIENGVHHPINYRTHNFVDEVRKQIEIGGLDFVFDSIGGSTFRKSFGLLGPGGKIVGYGAADRSRGGPIELLKLAFGFGLYHPVVLLMNSKGMIGVNMLRIADHQPDQLKRTMFSISKAYAAGDIKPISGGVFSANDLAKAHQLLESRNSIGKIAVVWDT